MLKQYKPFHISNYNRSFMLAAPTPTPKKRGRKSKKELEAIEEAKKQVIKTHTTSDNTTPDDTTPDDTTPDDTTPDDTNITIDLHTAIAEGDIAVKPLGKKRGRKPKGGKIIQHVVPPVNIHEPKPNVILHLKCSLKDLHSSNIFSSTVEGFSFESSPHLHINDTCTEHNANEYDNLEEIGATEKDRDQNTKDIWKKLKTLEHNLHINNVDHKKSACFWDTCEFDNPPVYIPKHYMNNSYHVYGCFCSPECAVAHLMNEKIDSSVKFERYQLMNHIYSKVYNYTKNIKPSPNPYYMLEKYYGNLSIQEYRALLKNDRLFLVVDKPLTRIMPELHEDNDDFIINNKIIPSNAYQVKKKLQKRQTKTHVLNERFGLTA